jgi:hypothetical protein
VHASMFKMRAVEGAAAVLGRKRRVIRKIICLVSSATHLLHLGF